MNYLYKDKRNGEIVAIERYVNSTTVVVRVIKKKLTYLVDMSNLERVNLVPKVTKTVD